MVTSDIIKNSNPLHVLLHKKQITCIYLLKRTLTNERAVRCIFSVPLWPAVIFGSLEAEEQEPFRVSE